MNRNNLSAVCRSILVWHDCVITPADEDKVTNFVASELNQIPDFLRVFFRFAASFFLLQGFILMGGAFRNATVSRQINHVARWRAYGGPCAEFVGLLESLVLFSAQSLPVAR